MSIRVRLVLMCLLVALLPAVPLTVLVKSLLEKSFDVGLNPAVEEALQSGLAISREQLDGTRASFLLNVQRTAASLGEARSDPENTENSGASPAGSSGSIAVSPDSVDAASVMARVVGASGAIDGLIVSRLPPDNNTALDLPGELRAFAGHPVLEQLVGNNGIVDRQDGTQHRFSFYETADRSLFLGVWRPAAGQDYRLLFYKRNDAEFLAHADRLLEGRQKFAELKLTQNPLTESFFFPFIIIYGVCLLLALGLALLIAERLSDPVRRLARGASAVANGDWDYRLDIKSGGETGRLVTAFNSMVARLDTQRRRLTDMEKMATWRDMARHLAHEIKNPLLPIRLTVEELRDQYKGDDETYRKILNDSTRIVSDELGSLQNLVKEFSSFAKMPDMNPRPGSLEQLVRDVSQMYTQIELTVDVTSAVPPFSFDSDQIRRVLVNLADNAVSVGASRVRVELRRVEDDAVLVFADNGPGIEAQHAGKIFDPYYTTLEKGTGLGLAMVKKIVLLHGGSITVSSVETPRSAGDIYTGARFEIRLPLSGPIGEKPI